MEDEKDIHEEDTEYQEKVRKTYLEIAEREGWVIVDCFKDSETLMPPEEIHKIICEKIF